MEKINIKFPNPSFHRRGTQEIRTEDKICPDKHILHIYKQTTQYIKKRTWEGVGGGGGGGACLLYSERQRKIHSYQFDILLPPL